VLAQPGMVGADLASEVTTAEPYVVPAEGERGSASSRSTSG
jgi:carbamoyl-phosphate synthase small subunit